MPNPVYENLKAGELSLGVWSDLLSAELIELCGSLGFDFVVLDAEHHVLEEAACAELVSVCEQCGLVSMVRVPSDNERVLRGFVETGCQGVYVPHVTTGAQARRVVDVVKGASRRGTSVGDDTMILALVEERLGVENIDEISRTEGIDVIGIGQTDLATSMGYEGRADHPEVIRVVRAAQRAILATGRAFDAVVTTGEEAEEARTNGALIVSVSVRGVIRTGLGQVLRQTAPAPQA